MAANRGAGEGVYFFSCGHLYKSAELRQYFSSPTSSSFVSSSALSALWPNDQNDAVFQLYDEMKDFQAKSLACPACLTQALKTMVIDWIKLESYYNEISSLDYLWYLPV